MTPFIQMLGGVGTGIYVLFILIRLLAFAIVCALIHTVVLNACIILAGLASPFSTFFCSFFCSFFHFFLPFFFLAPF